MANIKITVAEEPISPMQYNSFGVGQQTICGSTASQRNFKYNDTSGDFVVGKDFVNAAGFPANTLRILGFTDNGYFIENSTGNQTTATGFIPRRLKNILTNTIISTFPYEILISNIGQMGVENVGTELICPSDMVNNTAIRAREVTYRILDSNGNVGPIAVARFDNLPQ